MPKAAYTGVAGVARKNTKIYVGAESFTKRTLPSGYTQLEYIQSSGTQYINTGFNPSYNSRVIMDASGLSTGSTGQWLFGARNAGNSTASQQFCLYRTPNQTFRADYFGTNTTLTLADASARTVYERNANVVHLHGQTITNTAVTSGTVSYPLYILTLNNAGTAHANGAQVKLYSCKIYDNGTLVRDFVPCTNSSGTAGLYDLAGAQFYTNAGTGTFTTGSTYKSGVARKVKSGYVGVEGVARQFFVAGTPIGELSVGTSVYMNVNGARTEFIKVQEGLPSSLYDSSCNGSWLLMKNLCTKMVYYKGALATATNEYSKSGVHAYLSDTFFNLFDANVQNIIKEVKIPYRTGGGNNTTPVASGANGLQTKVFIPSLTEIHPNAVQTSGTFPVPNDGAILEYFNTSGSTLSNRRKATYDGTATVWWTRSPACSAENYQDLNCITGSGSFGRYSINASSYGIRPMIIVPSDTLVNDDFDVLA